MQTHLSPTWTAAAQASALREGWYLTKDTGARWKLGYVTLPNSLVLPRGYAPHLPSLQHAWARVLRGGHDFHAAARALLYSATPQAYDDASRALDAGVQEPRYLLAFPDYGQLDLDVPEGWVDCSDSVDVCPRFQAGPYVLWIDFTSAARSEIRGRHKRFVLECEALESVQTVLETDDWPLMRSRLQLIDTLRAAA